MRCHLGAERIGHGVRSVEDPHLLEQLIERGTILEVALTSNTQTRASAGFASHQIHDLLAAGVAVTLNTDNPTTSGTRLSEEYRRAENDAGIDQKTLQAIARTAARASFTTAGRALALSNDTQPTPPLYCHANRRYRRSKGAQPCPIAPCHPAAPPPSTGRHE
jgi:adenosine deaminase